MLWLSLLLTTISVTAHADVNAPRMNWERLREKIPTNYPSIVAAMRLLCSKEDLHADLSKTLHQFRTQANWLAAGYSMHLFDSKGRIEKVAFDSYNDLKRIVIARFEDTSQIRLYDIAKPRSWVEVDVGFDANCVINGFSVYGLNKNDVAESQEKIDPSKQRDPVCASNPTQPHPVIVAVVDGGVDYAHNELAQHVLRDSQGRVIYLNYRNFSDLNTKDAHGTHIAGIVSQHSPNILVLPVERPSDNLLGTGPGTFRWPLRTEIVEHAMRAINVDQYEAIAKAREAGARVMNLSFSTPYADSDKDRKILVASPRGMLDGFTRAIRDFSDVLFTVCAQNFSKNIDEMPFYPASVIAPNQITVASVDPDGTLSDFSNFGKFSVDLAAPGHMIDSLSPTDYITAAHKPGHQEMSGTSMAAPAVAHVAAEMIARNPKLTPAKIKEILCETVTPTKELKKITRCGGVLNAEAALQRATP